MRKLHLFLILYSISSLTFLVLFMQCESPQQAKRENPDDPGNVRTWNNDISENAAEMLDKGRAVFRFETFGDEAFWTDKLQLHKAIADQGAGGIGDGLSPKAALDAGLKVDIDVLPKFAKEAVAEGKLLNDVDFTLTLLKLNAVVGVVAQFDGGNLKSVGLTCAVCHSTVDSDTGIGKRLDGWPNQDLNVGAIVSMSPELPALAEMLDTDVDNLKKVLMSWGPGKFDAEL